MPAPEAGSPLVGALLQGSAPRPLRLSAARGVLPLARHDLVRILVVLLRDREEEVRREAGATLAGVPEDELARLLADPGAPPDLLEHFAADAAAPSALKDAILANPAAPVPLLITLAFTLLPAQIDLLLANQTRLIDSPDLLAALESLPALTPLQRSRCAEMRRHFLEQPVRKEEPARDVPPAPEVVRPPSGASAAPAGAPGGAPPAGAGPEEAASEQDPAAGASGHPGVADNALQKIFRMNTAEKVQLAMKGSREERGILIRDSSKVVQEAVLDSPKLTEQEIEAFAKMRTMTEDVLRIIAGNRDWIKNYAVMHALATNPKTPVGIAMNLLSRLTSHDIKLLIGDRNVAEAVRRQARKVSEARQQGGRGG